MNAHTQDFSTFQARIIAEQRAIGLRPGAMPNLKHLGGALKDGSVRKADGAARELSAARKAEILKMIAKRGLFTTEIYRRMTADLRHTNCSSLGSFLRDMARADLLTCEMRMNGKVRMGFWKAMVAK